MAPAAYTAFLQFMKASGMGVLVLLLLENFITISSANGDLKPVRRFHRDRSYPNMLSLSRSPPKKSVMHGSLDMQNKSMIRSEIPIVSEFYWATGGPYWLNSYGWDQLEQSGDNMSFAIDPCQWHGLTCSNGSAIKLVMMYNNLTGTLPESLVNLTNLQKIDFQYNFIQQTIPDSYCGWSQLYELGLRSNYLTGSIPNCIGELSALTILDLTSVNFDGSSPGVQSISGTLPESLCALKELKYLFLQSTQGISGSIPVCLGWEQQNLLALALHVNKLTGSIPESLCSIGHSLQDILLYENQLTGSFPDCIGQLNQLIWLETHNNFMTGPLPQSICNLNQLQIFQFDANRYTGSLPDCIGRMSSMGWFVGEKNSLVGTIPYSICNMTEMIYLVMGDNNIGGTIPSCIGHNISQLKMLEFNGNNIHNHIPESLCKLTDLSLMRLYDNKLSGKIPSCFGYSFPQLQVMLLHDNKLHGNLPSYWNLRSLNSITLSNNFGLKGKLPISMFNQSKQLAAIVIEGTRLSGSLPNAICYAKSLKTLALSGNQLTSSIPTCMFTNLKNLTTLRMASNRLSGTLPDKFCSMKSLAVLDLSNNMIGGLVPPSLGDISHQLVKTSIDLNRLSCDLPPSVLHWKKAKGDKTRSALNDDDFDDITQHGFKKLTMLYGNLFSCPGGNPFTLSMQGYDAFDEATEETKSYTCGGSDYVLPLLATCLIALPCTVVMIMFVKKVNQTKRITTTNKPSSDGNHLNEASSGEGGSRQHSRNASSDRYVKSHISDGGLQDSLLNNDQDLSSKLGSNSHLASIMMFKGMNNAFVEYKDSPSFKNNKRWLDTSIRNMLKIAGGITLKTVFISLCGCLPLYLLASSHYECQFVAKTSLSFLTGNSDGEDAGDYLTPSLTCLVTMGIIFSLSGWWFPYMFNESDEEKDMYSRILRGDLTSLDSGESNTVSQFSNTDESNEYRSRVHTISSHDGGLSVPSFADRAISGQSSRSTTNVPSTRNRIRGRRTSSVLPKHHSKCYRCLMLLGQLILILVTTGGPNFAYIYVVLSTTLSYSSKLVGESLITVVKVVLTTMIVPFSARISVDYLFPFSIPYIRFKYRLFIASLLLSLTMILLPIAIVLVTDKRCLLNFFMPIKPETNQVDVVICSQEYSDGTCVGYSNNGVDSTYRQQFQYSGEVCVSAVLDIYAPIYLASVLLAASLPAFLEIVIVPRVVAWCASILNKDLVMRHRHIRRITEESKRDEEYQSDKDESIETHQENYSFIIAKFLLKCMRFLSFSATVEYAYCQLQYEIKYGDVIKDDDTYTVQGKESTISFSILSINEQSRIASRMIESGFRQMIAIMLVTTTYGLASPLVGMSCCLAAIIQIIHSKHSFGRLLDVCVAVMSHKLRGGAPLESNSRTVSQHQSARMKSTARSATSQIRTVSGASQLSSSSGLSGVSGIHGNGVADTSLFMLEWDIIGCCEIPSVCFVTVALTSILVWIGISYDFLMIENVLLYSFMVFCLFFFCMLLLRFFLLSRVLAVVNAWNRPTDDAEGLFESLLFAESDCSASILGTSSHYYPVHNNFYSDSVVGSETYEDGDKDLSVSAHNDEHPVSRIARLSQAEGPSGNRITPPNQPSLTSI